MSDKLAACPCGSSGAKWIHDEVATKTQDFVVWAATERGSLHWRAGRSPSEIAFLNLLVDIMCKKMYDAPLKIAVRASQSAEEALQKDGIVQAVQAVEEKRAEEKPAAETQRRSPWKILATDASRRR